MRNQACGDLGHVGERRRNSDLGDKGQENLGEERFLSRFKKEIVEEIGFSKGFLDVYPLRMFDETRIFVVVLAKIS